MGRPALAEVLVMHKPNIQLDTAEEPGKKPFRWRGKIKRSEFDAICALDEAAGRDPRLEDVSPKASKDED